MQNKKLLLALLMGGALLLVGGRIFLYRSLTTSPTDLQADINQGNNIDANTGSMVELPMPEQEHKEQIPFPPQDTKPDISLDTVPEPSDEPFAPISIIVPPHLDPAALAQLRKEIYKTHKVLAEFEQAKTLQAYEEIISEQHGSATADIIMLPSNRFDSYIDRGAYIPSQQPLSPLFHPIVQTLVDHETTTFIPFSLDPYVTIYDQDIIFPSSITIGHLQQQLLSLVAKESHTLPLSFGVGPGDLFLLAQGKQAHPEYIDILQLIIAEAAHTRNTYIIEYVLQALGRDAKTLLATARQGQTIDTACMTLAHICLLKSQNIAISFGRMSSLALGRHLFEREYSETYNITNLPVSTNHYPLTTRGFVVNKTSPHLDEVAAWLRGYLEHAAFGNIPLRPYTLSAFNNIFNQQKIQDPYVQLLPHISSFYLVTGNINAIQTLAKDQKLQSMLAGDYSKIIYIKEQIE